MVTPGTGGNEERPVALWIDLHRISDGKVRCRGHLLGVGDACADVTPAPALIELVQAKTVEEFNDGVERAWPSAPTQFGTALGVVLLPDPVKDLLNLALSMRRPVEIRVRTHDDLDALPWEAVRFQLQSNENLSLKTIDHPDGHWVALLRQVDAHESARVDPDVTETAVVQLGPREGRAEDVQKAAAMFALHGHHTHHLHATDIRSLDACLPEEGTPSTALRVAAVYVHGHLGGLPGQRAIELDGDGVDYKSLERRLRTARTRIAVLNVCETADRLGGERSWIERLCASGAVQAAVGLKGRIDRFDESRHFAQPLIEALAAGGSVGAALDAVYAAFSRPEMVVAATTEHGSVTITGPGEGRRRRSRVRRAPTGSAPLALTVASASDRSLIMATRDAVTVEVRYPAFGERVSPSGDDPAFRRAVRVAEVLDVPPPAEVLVAVPATKVGFDWLWQPSVVAATVNAIAEAVGGVSASERAQAVQAVDDRWAADDPAVRRLVDDRTFPMWLTSDGRIEAAPLHAEIELDLVVLDHRVGRPELGILPELGDVTGLGNGDEEALARFLRPAVEAMVRGVRDRSTFDLAYHWLEMPGVLAVTALSTGRLAAIVPRGRADEAARTLQTMGRAYSRIRWTALPLVSR